MKYLLVLMLLPVAVYAQQATPVKVDLDSSSFKVITVQEQPDFLAADGDMAWVIDNTKNRIHKIDIASNKPLVTVNIAGACAAPVIAFDAVWVMSCTEKTLYKLDKNTGKIIGKIVTGVADRNGEMAIAAGAGSVWLLTDSAGILTRVNPANNTVQQVINVSPGSYCAGFGFNAVWVTNYTLNTVQKIDINTNRVTATIAVGKKPRFIAVGEQGVWTLNQGDGTVTKINPVTGSVAATVDVKAVGGGGDIAAGAGGVWVVSTNNQWPLQQIDPLTATIKTVYTLQPQQGKPFKVDGAVRTSKNYIWVSNLYRQTVWVLKN
jgi:YVTN family beta-propeller protein